METVITRCLAVKPGEDVLVVADDATVDIAEALRNAAEAAGGDTVLATMLPRAIDGTDPPPTVAAALAACDVFVAPTSRSISHTPARSPFRYRPSVAAMTAAPTKYGGACLATR